MFWHSFSYFDCWLLSPQSRRPLRIDNLSICRYGKDFTFRLYSISGPLGIQKTKKKRTLKLKAAFENSEGKEKVYILYACGCDSSLSRARIVHFLVKRFVRRGFGVVQNIWRCEKGSDDSLERKLKGEYWSIIPYPVGKVLIDIHSQKYIYIFYPEEAFIFSSNLFLSLT